MNLAKKFTNSTFLRHNTIFFTGSLGVSFLNYLYYPILGRLLSVQAFGEVQVIVSLFTQLMIFMAVLGQVTINVVANYTDETKKQKVVFELEHLAMYLSLGLSIVAILFGWKLKSFLHFHSIWPFYTLMVAFVASVPFTFRSAYLRGKQLFGAAIITNIISSLTKIIVSVGFVLIGFGTVGAVGGLIAAQLVALLYAANRARKVGFMKPTGGKYSMPDLESLTPELRYSLFVLAASLFTVLLSSIDILTVKHYFSPTVAGQYAGISIVSNIVLFITGSVTQVLLPSVKIHQSRRDNRAYLLKSAGMLGVIGGATALFFVVFPDFVVRVLMGGNYVIYARLLPLLALAMFMLSALNLIVGYYMALRVYRVGVIIAIGTLITLVLMLLHHLLLINVIQNLIYGISATLLLLGFWRIIFRRQETS